MNDKFFELPEEKQRAMLNGAMYVFARNEYNKASTEAIATRGGISKSLLFFYFGSKQELYLYTFRYAIAYSMAKMREYSCPEERDFFKILANAQRSKMRILAEHPDLMVFLVKAYYEEAPEIKPHIGEKMAGLTQDAFGQVLQRADLSKFREDVSPMQVLHIILWMAEGYMRSRTPKQLQDFEALNEEYQVHIDLLRRRMYKESAEEEEQTHGGN